MLLMLGIGRAALRYAVLAAEQSPGLFLLGRLAQAVLAREDPQETFLKSLTSKPAPVEVIYPVRGLGHVVPPPPPHPLALALQRGRHLPRRPRH
jgi:hypothetical protein